MTGTPARWAAFRLGRLGDVALATGVLEYWRQRRGFRFAFMTREAFAPILGNHPALENVTAIGPGDLSSLGAWIVRARALAREYRGWGLLDLHGTLRSHILSLAWQGPVKRAPKHVLARRLYRLGGFSRAREILMKTNVPQRYSLALENTPPPPTDLLPVVRLTDMERAVARKRLAELGLARPFAALHPYATHVNKAWPNSRWDELITLLRSRQTDYLILGKNPAPLKPKDPRDLTGSTSLRETCALLAESSVLVTGDSGPMHLASAVGTPVAALFGPTDRAWGFYPAGPRDTVLELPMDCRPCSLHGRGECERGLACLAEITADKVFKTLKEYL